MARRSRRIVKARRTLDARDFEPSAPRGHRSEIFAHGGARATAAQFGVDFLAEIPLDLEVRETSDSGRPIVVSDPAHPIAEAYRNLALSVRDKVAAARGGAP